MIINNNICNLNDDTLVKLHLHGSPSYSFEGNNKLIKASSKFMLTSERFLTLSM